MNKHQIGDRVRITHEGWAKIVEMNPLPDGKVLVSDITDAGCTVVRVWPEYGLLSIEHPLDFTVLLAPESLERVDNT